MIPRSTSPLVLARLLKPGGKSRQALFLMVSAFMVVCISTGTLIALNVFSLKSARAATNNAITTYKGDNNRTGAFSNETALNKSNVNATSFGRHVTYPVDGQVYAEPLFVPNLTIGGTTHNVVFVETEHDGVYAFDADQTTPTQPLWYKSLLPSGATSVPSGDVACSDMVPEIGITGTPVIDSTTNTMYVVSYTKENGHHFYRLHAMDITTGQDKQNPVQIGGSVAGSGAGSTGGQVPFRSDHERQRSALLMANGQIYISFASFCDNQPYHGWIMAYDTSFHQKALYNDTPNGSGGGIWGGGSGLSADSSGNIYTITGNGTFDLNTGGHDAGDSFVKFNGSLQRSDHFTPFNQQCLAQADSDLGSGGPLQIPGTNEHVGVGKEGRIYVVDDNNMGKFTAAPGGLNCNNVGSTTIDKVKQEFSPHFIGGEYNTPSYWNNTVYFSGAKDHTKAFTFNPGTGKLSSQPTSQTPESFGFSCSGATISSNGTDTSTAIVWIIDPLYGLRAYDATNLSKELYSSKLSSFTKFSVPSVANGEVFVGTQNSLVIYGLLSPNPTPTSTSTPTPTSTSTPTPTPVPGGYNNVGTTDDTQPGIGNFDGSTNTNSYSAQALQNAGVTPGTSITEYGATFVWPNASAGSANNYVAQGQVLPVTPVSNAGTLAFLGAANNGPSSGQATITYADNTTQTFTLGFSDWTLNGGTASPSFNNQVALSMPYRNTPKGEEIKNVYVFYAEVGLDTNKTLQSVTLPSSVNTGRLHVFAISTRIGAPYAATAYTNVGTSLDSNTRAGNFDGGGSSYSAQALQAVSVKPGSTFTTNGASFIWPAAPAGSANNYVASGQTIPVNGANGSTYLAFLGASSNGPHSGTITITYTDGTTSTATVGFSDWTLNAGKVNPSFGNAKAVSMSYRNGINGKQTVTTYVFYAEVAVTAGKTVASVTLPSPATPGYMHIFAVATH